MFKNIFFPHIIYRMEMGTFMVGRAGLIRVSLWVRLQAQLGSGSNANPAPSGSDFLNPKILYLNIIDRNTIQKKCRTKQHFHS